MQFASSVVRTLKLIYMQVVIVYWPCRNKLVHEGKQRSKTETVTFILGYVRELELLTGERVEQAAEETVVWRSPSNPFVQMCTECLGGGDIGWYLGQELGFWAVVVEGNSSVVKTKL
ncbi:hypothetical protein PVK06_009678 [Gossypium arboreum]|uniref:Uncharacterized protein n=1 Tax=Gossypium arboreum TaxID=29729 RepID=A0ABR0QN94_GOSAR|nr:hypothetical protein PVK06_009678 [Gossypium arboreum]